MIGVANQPTSPGGILFLGQSVFYVYSLEADTYRIIKGALVQSRRCFHLASCCVMNLDGSLSLLLRSNQAFQ
jgi:hypothetical protein